VIEQETTRLPVRSALFKQDTGGSVVRWVTTSESPQLYVFAFLHHSAMRVGLEKTHIRLMMSKQRLGRNKSLFY
jgi:hypothetical protein